jgi:hypothetical protein
MPAAVRVVQCDGFAVLYESVFGLSFRLHRRIRLRPRRIALK